MRESESLCSTDLWCLIICIFGDKLAAEIGNWGIMQHREYSAPVTTNINLISRILYKFHLDLIISYHVCSSWSCQFLLWCMCDNEWEVKLSYAIVNKGTHIYCIDYWLNVWTISIPLHHIEFWRGENIALFTANQIKRNIWKFWYRGG